ncbi:MAG: hypothetical protein NC398_06615 [Acetatifactor muris]|nr:hypothetical protein [Acetatifactor muris]MCM1528217.1 hypothetical protein [Bacteroides sp.]
MKNFNWKAFCQKYLTTENIKMLILFIPLTILLITQWRNGQISFSAFLDTSVLVSFILVFISELAATMISNAVGKKYEDSSKLSTDYDALAKRYSREKLIEYHGVRFPVICLASRPQHSSCFDIQIRFSDQRYKLPKQIADRSDHLMSAHNFSKVYNNTNIRINDLTIDRGTITLQYSMTTFYDSLITNRSMDYALPNNKTIREIYEPGPFLSRLSESKLSNHLGFNGFVETADGKIIFVLRSNNVSIGKNTLADSIGASLKAKYCLDDDRKLTVAGISNAIRREIYDELRIPIDADINLCENIFAFYRDIVEGGKPQFLFYYKCDQLTSEQFEQMFQADLETNHIQKGNVIIDGAQFIYLSLPEIRQCAILPGKLILPDGETSYAMMPSASASIVMLLEYLS